MAKAEVQLALNASNFMRGMAMARSSFGGFSSTVDHLGGHIKSMLLGITGGFSAELFAHKLFEGVKGVLELSHSLETMSRKSGIGVRDLVKLEQTFKDSGIEAEDMGMAISRMQKNIGNGANVFSKIGLTSAKLRGLSPSDQVVLIGKRLSELSDPARRAAAAIDIFGRSGANMLKAFMSPEFGAATAQLRSQAAALEANSEDFSRVAVKLQHAGLAMRGFFIGFTKESLAPLEKLLDRMEHANLEEKGQNFARWMGEAWNSVSKVVGAINSIHVPDWIANALPKAPAFMQPVLDAIPGAPAHKTGTPTERGMGDIRNSEFFKSADPRERFKKPFSPFMTQAQRGTAQTNEFYRRYPNAREDPDFVRKYLPGSIRSLEQWGDRMGVHGGAYSAIRSRSRAERAAEKKERESEKTTAIIARDSMVALGKEVAGAVEKTMPK